MLLHHVSLSWRFYSFAPAVRTPWRSPLSVNGRENIEKLDGQHDFQAKFPIGSIRLLNKMLKSKVLTLFEVLVKTSK